MWIKRDKKDTKRGAGRRPATFLRRGTPKNCRLCQEDLRDIDYKDLERVGRFVTERGKIMPSRISGACATHQRSLAVAIKRARYMALLPYVAA